MYRGRTFKLFGRWPLLVVGFALLLAACGSGSEESDATVADGAPTTTAVTQTTDAEASGALEVTEISIGLGFDPGLAPHIIALEKGWFEEAGFTVKTSTYSAGALAGEALAAGEIQLWTPANVPPISMRHNGLPIVVVGTSVTGYIEKFVARADANIETPEDLTKIRIGLLEGSTASAVMGNIAAAFGVDPSALQIVNLPPPEQVTALAQNDVQAIVVWNPWPYQAEQASDVELEILWEGSTSYFPWADGDTLEASATRSVFVMTEDFVRTNPNTANAIMQVLFRAQTYLEQPENREETIEIFSTYNDQPVEMNTAIWDDYGFDTSFDEAYVKDMSAYTQFLFDAGRIEEMIDPLDYSSSLFVENYNPDLVEVEGRWAP